MTERFFDVVAVGMILGLYPGPFSEKLKAVGIILVTTWLLAYGGGDLILNSLFRGGKSKRAEQKMVDHKDLGKPGHKIDRGGWRD